MLKSIKKMFSKTRDESESSPSSEEKQTSNSFDLEAFKMSEDIKVFALSTCIHCRNAKNISMNAESNTTAFMSTNSLEKTVSKWFRKSRNTILQYRFRLLSSKTRLWWATIKTR